MSWSRLQQINKGAREGQLFTTRNVEERAREKRSEGGIQVLRQDGMKLLSQEQLTTVFNSYNVNNSSIIQMVKSVSYENRIKLQKFCVSNFDNLPIFLLYELSIELGLTELEQVCKLKLLEENYEQFNYLRMDLLKISVDNFHRIFEEYYGHVNNLEIQGLRASDIKSVISDYCMMNALDDTKKQDLMKKYAQGKGIGFVVAKRLNVGATGQKEVRRSMIETRKGETQIQSPMRGKNSTIALPRTPNGCYIGSATELDNKAIIRKSLRNIKTLRSNEQEGGIRDSKQSAVVIQKQIEQFVRREQDLYEQILETKKLFLGNESEKEIKMGLDKLAQSMKQMEKQVEKQNRKLEELQRGLYEIGKNRVCGGTCASKIDYLFGF